MCELYELGGREGGADELGGFWGVGFFFLRIEIVYHMHWIGTAFFQVGRLSKLEIYRW